MVEIDDEVQMNRRYYQSLRNKSVPSSDTIEQTDALVKLIQCIDGLESEPSEDIKQRVLYLEAILCGIRVIVPYLTVFRAIMVNFFSRGDVNPTRANQFRCRQNQVFGILCTLDNDDALRILRKVECQDSVYDELVVALEQRNQEAFNRILSQKGCNTVGITCSCGILSRYLRTIDYSLSCFDPIFSPESLVYLVSRVDALPDLEDDEECSEEYLEAILKLVFDLCPQQPILDMYPDHQEEVPSLSQWIELTSRTVCSAKQQLEKSKNNQMLNSTEVRILEGILNRPEAVPFTTDDEEEVALPRESADVKADIPYDGTFDDFMSAIKKKYNIELMNSHASSDRKSFFYKTYNQLNDEGSLSPHCLEKIDKIFECLTQHLRAIDVSESNYAKILFLYSGKDILGNGGKPIEWKASHEDFFCFVKNLVVDGKKYKKAAEHFLFTPDIVIDKSSSRAVRDSSFVEYLENLYSNLGLHRLKENA